MKPYFCVRVCARAHACAHAYAYLHIPEQVILDLCFRKESLSVRCAWVEEEEKPTVGGEGRRHVQALKDG